MAWVYVSGSHNALNNTYGWAYLGMSSYNYEVEDSGVSSNYKDFAKIAGEVEATKKAIEFFYSEGERELEIWHNYIGIAEWANHTWKAKNICSKAYVRLIDKYKKLGMKITFIKLNKNNGNEYSFKVNRAARKICKNS